MRVAECEETLTYYAQRRNRAFGCKHGVLRRAAALQRFLEGDLQNMTYELILMAHTGALIGALACLVGAEFLFLAARSRPASFANPALAVRRIGSVLSAIGIIAGVALLVIGQWPLLTPWLVTSFVLIALLIAVGRRLVEPWENRLKSSLGAGYSSGTGIGPMLGEARPLIGRLIVIGLFFAIIGLMSVKPDPSLLL
jgi:hypothetical protein